MSRHTCQNYMSVYGYIAEKGQLTGKTWQRLLTRNPISAPEGTELPLWSRDWKRDAKTGALWSTPWRSRAVNEAGAAPTLPHPTLAGDSSDRVLHGTTEQCQHQLGIQASLAVQTLQLRGKLCRVKARKRGRICNWFSQLCPNYSAAVK